MIEKIKYNNGMYYEKWWNVLQNVIIIRKIFFI